MKRTTTAAIAVAVAVSLALAGTAMAGSTWIRQTGQIVGDSATSVKLRVKVKNGQPEKISGFVASDVLTRCGAKRNPRRFQYSALNPIPVHADDSFNTVLLDDSIGLRISLVGVVKRHGAAVVGTIKTNRFEPGKNQTCKVPKQRFKTAK